MRIGNQRKNNWEPVVLKPEVTSKYIIGWVIRIVLLLVLIVVFIWSQSNLLLTKTYVYSDMSVPKTFVGYHVVHVGDMYNTGLDVVGKVKKCKPDIIIVSGGYVDDRGKFNRSVKTINKLSEIAPTFFVFNSNDEDYKNEILAEISSEAHFIEDDSIAIDSPEVDADAFINEYIGKRIISMANKGDEEASAYIQYTKDSLNEDAKLSLRVTGISTNENDIALVEKVYDMIGTNKDILQFMVAGDVSWFDKLSTIDLDVVFSGSTLGDKTKNPTYVKGMYSKDGTTLFLTGGVGKKSGYAGRFLNYPEITSIILSDGTIKDENPLEKLLGFLVPSVGTKFDNDGGFAVHKYEYKDRYGMTTQGANPGG